MRSNRLWATLAVLALLLVPACAEDDGVPTAGSVGTTEADGSAEGAGTTGADGPATADDGADGSEDTRTVEGAYGPVEIPTEPQRIVGDLMTADYLTALGYDTSRLVGVFGADFFASGESHYLDELWDRGDLVDLGFTSEANLEALAAADPDLIMVPFDQIDGSELLDEIQQIAPTLVVPTSDEGDSAEVRYGGSASFQDWRSTLRAYGALLGLEDAAEDHIAETQSRIAELVAEHGDTIASVSATEAKSTPDYMAINVLDAARTTGVLGTILMSELGFSPPAAQEAVQPDEYGTIELSAENLALVDGDLLFLEVREGSTVHEESPLWSTLSVVQSGNVVVVGNHWEFGGAVAARQVLEDIDQALTAYEQG